MSRASVANTVLWPVDRTLGGVVWGLERAGLLGKASGLSVSAMRAGLRALFTVQNQLLVEGADFVPERGGVILACNHQSWLDVQVVGATSPRHVCFVAKRELGSWPALRHLIRLSGSILVDRAGDEVALAALADELRSGKVVAIYPEGTIPGEEDIPRHAVDPTTGLLRGHTGVARLALAAGVPIVPVGVSGTGRALPPEVYPRLELLRPPGDAPIRIRFGAPIHLERWADRAPSRALFREITDEVMAAISGLVDHRSGYVPLSPPLRPPRRARRLGVLLLHGFTSHLRAVDGLVPHLEAAGIDWEAPVLRGHGTRPEDLRGVRARDWVADAERALMDLRERVDKVVVVGLSMGGLVGLELARRHPAHVAGLVTVAAALRFADPLSALTPLLARVVRSWPSPEAFSDRSLARNSRNYPRFATDAFASLHAFAREVEGRLPEVHVPIRVLQSKADQVVAPVSANLIYEKVASPLRELVWYQRSGHEMMQDLEADQVFADIMAFVLRFQAEPRPVEARDSRPQRLRPAR